MSVLCSWLSSVIVTLILHCFPAWDFSWYAHNLSLLGIFSYRVSRVIRLSFSLIAVRFYLYDMYLLPIKLTLRAPKRRPKALCPTGQNALKYIVRLGNLVDRDDMKCIICAHSVIADHTSTYAIRKVLYNRRLSYPNLVLLTHQWNHFLGDNYLYICALSFYLWHQTNLL